ncbi:GerAB/ArcD/ProY family transporter [Paenibacillus aurantiacus]|uniref:GerAB/ArcD/ProY family transporter n=1 Tax=Paenibacillus aurantiacus TaxID=1936118 RepID=A0ABV5KU21_9BACL
MRSRYFFYLFLIGMLINTIFFVPRILLEERYNGAVTAVFCGIVLGTILSFLFIWAMNRHPGKGIPELFAAVLPPYIRIPILLYLFLMWAISGSIILIAFSFIVVRFLSPETSHMLILVCFCCMCCWAATRRPLAIIGILEVIMLINIPLVIFIMGKSVSSPFIEWDSVRIFTDYIFHKPSWTALSAATYPFTGYINLSIYNRMFKKSKIKQLWLIPLIGASVLLISFFIPIALLGERAVGDYLYTWISAVDTLRMQYGFIERVVYLFLFIYISFSLLFITLTWNIALLLMRSSVPSITETSERSKVIANWVVAIAISVITCICGLLTNDKQLIEFTKFWLSLRFTSEMLLVGLVVWISWRVKHEVEK